MSEPTRVQTYRGPTQQAAWEAYQRDAAEAARYGWVPVGHQWGADFLQVTYQQQAAPPPPTPPVPGPPVAAVQQAPAPPVTPAVAPSPAPPPSSVAAARPEDIDVYVERALAGNDPKEIKLVIQQLRLMKKEFAQVKKEATTEITSVRADYSSRVAQRGSKVRGGGTLGRMARAYQTAQRDADRREVDSAIQPLVERRERADRGIHEVDSTILQLERRLLEFG